MQRDEMKLRAEEALAGSRRRRIATLQMKNTG
jgi:hypothetical protein